MFDIDEKCKQRITVPDPLGFIEEQRRKLKQRPIRRRGFTPNPWKFNTSWGLN